MTKDTYILSLESPMEKVTIEVPMEDYCSLDDFMSLIPRLVIGAGWMPGSLPNALGDFNDYIETLKKENHR